jgi:tetratricopeptide (TPR) repeat protein
MAEAATSAEQARLQLRRAQALLDIGRHNDAVPLLSDALRLNPQSVEAYCYLGLALQRAGELNRCLSVLDEAIKLDPNNEWPHRLQSIAYKELGQHQAALEKAREAQRLSPDAWETLHTLAEALLVGQQLPEAQKAAERLRRVAPEKASTFSVLGRIALAGRQLLHAEMHFREALRLDPQNVNAHNNVGSALLEQGRVKEAMAFFDSALTLSPTAKVAQSNLYLGARRLRSRSWLATSRSLLMRISPKVYNYYLHREQDSFKIFFFVFLCKLVLPLAALLTVVACGIQYFTGDVNVPGFIMSGLALVAFFLALARWGWTGSYFMASATQVQLITTLSAWLFSPLTLGGLGGLGLALDPDRWVIYLLMLIVGVTFLARRAVGEARGVLYRLVSGVFPKLLTVRSRWARFVAESRAGRGLCTTFKVLKNPATYLGIGIAGTMYMHGDPAGAAWFPVIIISLSFSLFKGLRLIPTLLKWLDR